METLGIWVGVLIQCVVAAFVYGRLAERVASHERRLTLLERDVKDHGEHIARLGIHKH